MEKIYIIGKINKEEWESKVKKWHVWQKRKKENNNQMQMSGRENEI